MKQELISLLQRALEKLGYFDITVSLNQPSDLSHGDHTTNIALVLSSKFKKDSSSLAQQIVDEALKLNSGEIQKIEAVNGFINFWSSQAILLKNLRGIIESDKKTQVKSSLYRQKILVEYGHPNTHKEMHIGHLRTLITGESLARLFEANQAVVFRANYQGDIGPHVAKALFGIELLIKERLLTEEKTRSWSHAEKAHFLGEGYVRGNQEYGLHKDEIEKINSQLYNHQGSYWDLYMQTRKLSLDYFDEIYKRFYTKYDQLFFESEVADCGRAIVKKHLNQVFIEDQGAVIFPGEKYGLHRRVFITKEGNPTYEGKDMCLAFRQYDRFPFDKNIHVVGNEQSGYFKVVIKALELIDPEKFKNKEYHLAMGMVSLKDQKMSSRSGAVLSVDWLIDEVKKRVEKLVNDGKILPEDQESAIEKIVIGAVKYSVLRVGTSQDVIFDIDRSVALDGDSAPYLQYTYARSQRVFEKSKKSQYQVMNELVKREFSLNLHESNLLRMIYRFENAVEDSARNYSPNIICAYLFDLAKIYNLFYQKYPIIKSPSKDDQVIRLALSLGVGKLLKQGLYLLGIEAPERM